MKYYDGYEDMDMRRFYLAKGQMWEKYDEQGNFKPKVTPKFMTKMFKYTDNGFEIDYPLTLTDDKETFVIKDDTCLMYHLECFFINDFFVWDAKYEKALILPEMFYDKLYEYEAFEKFRQKKLKENYTNTIKFLDEFIINNYSKNI